jgi:hypothetical protein
MAIDLFPMALYRDELDPIVVNNEEERQARLAEGWKDRPTYDPKKEDYDPNMSKVIAVEFQKFPCAVYHPDGRAEVARNQVALDRYLLEGWAERIGEWDERGTIERKVETLRAQLDEAEAQLAAFDAEQEGKAAGNALIEEEPEKRGRGNPNFRKKA